MSYLKLVCSIIPYLCIYIGTLSNLVQMFWLHTEFFIIYFVTTQLGAETRKKFNCLSFLFRLFLLYALYSSLLSKNISKVYIILHHRAIPQVMSQGSKIASARQWFTVWSMVRTMCFKMPCLNKNLNEIFPRGLIQRFPLSYIYKQNNFS